MARIARNVLLTPERLGLLQMTFDIFLAVQESGSKMRVCLNRIRGQRNSKRIAQIARTGIIKNGFREVNFAIRAIRVKSEYFRPASETLLPLSTCCVIKVRIYSKIKMDKLDYSITLFWLLSLSLSLSVSFVFRSWLYISCHYCGSRHCCPAWRVCRKAKF